MTNKNLIINGVDHAKFDLEWAKRGGVLICADPGSTKKLFKFVRNIDLEKIEVTVLGWLDGCPVTNFWESKTIFRMATPKEAGIEYIKRPVSDEELAELRKDNKCASCTNLGKAYGLTQETYCDSCIYAEPWRKDNYNALKGGECERFL